MRGLSRAIRFRDLWPLAAFTAKEPCNEIARAGPFDHIFEWNGAFRLGESETTALGPLRKGLIGVSFLMRARKRFSIHRGWVSEASGPCLGLLWS